MRTRVVYGKLQLARTCTQQFRSRRGGRRLRCRGGAAHIVATLPRRGAVQRRARLGLCSARSRERSHRRGRARRRSAGGRAAGPHLPRLRPPLAIAARHRPYHMDRDRRASTTAVVGGASAGSRLRLARGRHTRDAPRTPRRLSATGVVVNFLTRLAQRNLGIANLVHPRLPSTFEPVYEGANMLSAVEAEPLASPPDLPSLVS